jgi:hypothetical protein
MTDIEDTIMVFTARSPERILNEGGKSGTDWKVIPVVL